MILNSIYGFSRLFLAILFVTKKQDCNALFFFLKKKKMKFITNSTPNASTNQRCTAHGDIHFLFAVDKPRFSTPTLVCKFFREKHRYEKELSFLLYVCLYPIIHQRILCVIIVLQDTYKRINIISYSCCISG